MNHLFHFTLKDTENEESDEESFEEEDEKLPKVKPPYLPPKALGMSPYTLVLDLDETLIHFEDVRISLIVTCLLGIRQKRGL